MPIKGLTTNAKIQLPIVGKLRKGAPKISDKQPGKDLDNHFRFTSNDPNTEAQFTSLYGEGDQLNDIEVMLFYDSTEENFEAWMESYNASSLLCRHDGENCHLWMDEDGVYRTDLISVNDCKHAADASPVGRLTVIMPRLNRLAFVTVETHSKNDILRMQSQLQAIEQGLGSLKGVPFVLSRKPDKISTPKSEKVNGKWVQTGKRVRRKKWLLSLEVAPSYVHNYLTLSGQSAEQRLLGSVGKLQVFEGDAYGLPEGQPAEVQAKYLESSAQSRQTVEQFKELPREEQKTKAADIRQKMRGDENDIGIGDYEEMPPAEDDTLPAPKQWIPTTQQEFYDTVFSKAKIPQDECQVVLKWLGVTVFRQKEAQANLDALIAYKFAIAAPTSHWSEDFYKRQLMLDDALTLNADQDKLFEACGLPESSRNWEGFKKYEGSASEAIEATRVYMNIAQDVIEF